MPINHEHQLALLKDILTEHSLDCCGTVSECEQLERVIKSLLGNDNINDNVKGMLQEIYSYSQGGKYSGDLDQHISNHQSQLSQWISDFDQYS
jgi:predicted Zn-dependent peptidase